MYVTGMSLETAQSFLNERHETLAKYEGNRAVQAFIRMDIEELEDHIGDLEESQ